MGAHFKLHLIMGAVILGLLGALNFAYHRYTDVKQQRDQVIKFSNAKQDSLVYFKNNWGRETARSAVLDLTLRNLKRLQSDERLAWVKQFESVNKRLNNLESATRAVAHAVGQWSMPTVPVDTTKRDDWAWVNDSTWLKPDIRLFDNHDEWIRIQGTITADTVVVHADANVPIESVVVWQRKKLFGLVRMWPAGKEWFTETASPNPYVRITESTVIRVDKRKKQ